MEKNFSPELTLYGQILFAILFIALAGLVMALLRRVFVRPEAAGARSVTGLRFRLLLPVSLLAAAGLAKLPVLRTALPLGAKFFRFVDAAFVFSVIFFLVRLFDGLVRVRYEKKERPFPLPRVLHGFFLIVVYIAAALAILREFLGFNITPLLAGSAILTAVLGLALQGVLGNVFSGMSLHYTKSFSRGDWVKVGEMEGQVVDTNWRETRLRDRASNIVVIPNTVVASQTIVNFSLPDRASAVVLPIKVDFLAPPAVVLGLLVEAARETAGVLAEPAPTAYLQSYDEFGLSYLAKFWISDYGRRPAIAGEVGRLVWHKLRRLGIEIPVPVESKLKDILRVLRPSEDRIAEISTEKEKNFQDFARSAFLQFGEGEKAGQPLLSDPEIRELASRADRRRFGAGEVIFRQGDPGEVCYLVAGGRVKGEIAYEENGKAYTTDFTVGPGGLVGEMSLFTGMPRTATVVVAEEAELLEIRAGAFAALLARNPQLTDAVAEVVSGRNRANLETLRKVKDLAARDIEAGADKKSVLEYLKKLVHLFKR
ncbi:MAG: mechanosensitive ion channel [Acidobacteria bacterium]|nr:mechanosensitive ion channel [Acidobacteriota bacterium]MBE3129979.1 mechanosensitive ion channel [Acidobacteriota bacterium]